MKSKRFSGLAKIWVSVLLMTCGAAFAGSGLQTKNGETPVLPPGKRFERVLMTLSIERLPIYSIGRTMQKIIPRTYSLTLSRMKGNMPAIMCRS
jgi:hypothetical protein